MNETDEEFLANYLRLEFGEDKNDANSIKASDLEYVGEFIIKGIVTRFWSFPTSGEPMWAIIEELDDAPCAGMTNVAPPKQ